MDNESSAHIIFTHVVQRMMLKDLNEDPNNSDVWEALYGFENNPVPIQGTISLPITCGTPPFEVTALVRHYIIDIASPYIAIIGGPTLFSLGAIISAPHMKVKFPTPYGLGELRSDTNSSHLCYSTSLSLAQTRPKKRKFYGESKDKSAGEPSLRTHKVVKYNIFEIRKVLDVEHTIGEAPQPPRIPKAQPGEPMDQVQIEERNP